MPTMTHPLKEWLAKQTPRRTMNAFAEDIGVHVITLRRLVNAEDSVTRETFEKVETGTNGELNAVALYAHYRQQRDAIEGGHGEAARELPARA